MRTIRGRTNVAKYLLDLCRRNNGQAAAHTTCSAAPVHATAGGGSSGGGNGHFPPKRADSRVPDDNHSGGRYSLLGIVFVLVSVKLYRCMHAASDTHYSHQEYLPLQAAGSQGSAEARTAAYPADDHQLVNPHSNQPVPAAASPSSCSDDSAPERLSIQDAFAGRTVFLTGATGFVGSLVLEQLLRTCPDLQKVYVLVREKRGVLANQRLHRLLFTNPLFHLLCGVSIPGCSNNEVLAGSSNQLSQLHEVDDIKFADVASKVEAIAGDLTLPGFGIADSDMQKLRAETEVVIHAAASISFDDHIHDAIMHNYTVSAALVNALMHVHSNSPIHSHMSAYRIVV